MGVDKLTKRMVEKLECPPDKKQVSLSERKADGFSVICYSSGKKVFCVVYGPRDKRRKEILGTFGQLTVDEARSRAIEIRRQWADGVDPVVKKAQERERHVLDQLMFSDWVERYLVNVTALKRDRRSDHTYLRLASKRFGSKPLSTITSDDVRKVVETYRAKGKKTTANRCLASIRACLQAAWREDLIDSNPAMKIKQTMENPGRTRTLSEDEIARLVNALGDLEDPHVRMAFTLLLATGCRRSEVLGARWSDLDLDARTWRIPRAKSGRTELIPLSSSIVAQLATLERVGPFVLPGKDPQSSRTDLNRPWRSLCKAADLRGIVLHDLRRTFGLFVARTDGIHVASKMLRHSNIQVTVGHYGPLGLEDLRPVSEKMGELLFFSAAKGKKSTDS